MPIRRLFERKNDERRENGLDAADQSFRSPPRRAWTVTDGRPDETELQPVLDAIAAAVDPDRIILFGSAARGTMTADSDVDLLVVKRTDDLRALRAAVRAALAANRRPVDVVAGTPRMLDEQRRCLSMVYGPALRDGIVSWARSARETAGAPAWSTLPERKGTSGEMVRTLRFRREEADTRGSPGLEKI